MAENLVIFVQFANRVSLVVVYFGAWSVLIACYKDYNRALSQAIHVKELKSLAADFFVNALRD